MVLMFLVICHKFWCLSCAGFPLEAFNNPADFFLDVVNADTEADESRKEEEQEELNKQMEDTGKIIQSIQTQTIVKRVICV